MNPILLSILLSILHLLQLIGAGAAVMRQEVFLAIIASEKAHIGLLTISRKKG